MKTKDIIKHEFIGLELEVTDSKNESDLGIMGRIIDETRNTFLVNTDKGKKRLFKSNITFKIRINKKMYKINGKILIGNPKDRIKK